MFMPPSKSNIFMQFNIYNEALPPGRRDSMTRYHQPSYTFHSRPPPSYAMFMPPSKDNIFMQFNIYNEALPPAS
ncbi:hypothetical protein DdX_17063 [Ditylenchus destructor]|uniref:Uncharacterized protein n=1 Tax=Ditylenchus destructor TaxID=166010 RepID=A0AAD4MP23_9BILA|nr:hypothetical protein DdX_17063 [Ditylenchus destructor]